MDDMLDRTARRMEQNPFFLAGVLAAYARSENLDDAGLAAALGLDPARLSELRLCRAPHADARRFNKDIDRLAEVFGIDADRAAEVVRAGMAARHADDLPPDGRGTLAAARDHEPPG